MSELDDFRTQKDEFFHSDHHSPLTPEQKADFNGLNYYPENLNLDIEVEVETFPEHDEVRILTNTGDVQRYERYGRFKFEVDGQEAELTIYSNEHGFFLPFADSLAGKETYGAGRYLEPTLLPDGRLHVDFNLAYLRLRTD
jgi:uncharacterized protein (DUF1684 family)